MAKLLTIAIPTYNRAELLNKQLAWLSQAIKGYESDCEIFISDNCSTDNTQEIIQKWQDKFDIHITNHRNAENLGVMRNLVHCYDSAQTQYVWAIGDDDPVEDEAIPYIINKLKLVPDLSFLILNFSLRDTHANRVLYESTFDVEEELLSDGKAYIENYLASSHRGLGFLSAQIYRTSTIKEALQSWSSSVNNLEAQVYWGAYCASKGKVNISKKIYVENAHVRYKPKQRVRMHFVDLPQVFVKLMSIGYCPEIFRKRIVDHFGQKGIGILQPLLKRFPIFTVNVIIPKVVWVASQILPLKKEVQV